MNWTFEPELIAVRLNRKLDAQVFETLLTIISPEKKEAIHGYFREEDKLRSLIGELLIRKVLMERCGLKNTNIRFMQTENGKPMLAGAEHLHFNSSHAGDWVVCAIDKKPIGVDVEKVKPANLAVSRSFFSEEEHLDICNAADPNERFFDYWTLKESFIKHSGKGLSQELNSFTIFFSENTIGVLLEGKTLENGYLKQYFPEEGYKLAVCASSEVLPETIQYYSLDEVIGFFLAV